MRHLQLVIFDCDGVLVDSERISNGVLAEILGEYGLPLSLEETIERFIGRSLPQCVEIIATLLGHEPPADFRAQFAQRTWTAFGARLAPVAGVEEVLRSISLPCCVASNGNRAKMNFTLGRTGLLGRFRDRMYCAEDVAEPKPAPDLFLHAARCHAADPSRCIVVEDTPTGITAARAAGMGAYGFAAMTPGARLKDAGAHVVFSDMSDLPTLLAQHQVHWRSANEQ